MNYDSITPKQEALMRCDGILNSAERMTSGNYMHNKNNILYQVQKLKEFIINLKED